VEIKVMNFSTTASTRKSEAKRESATFVGYSALPVGGRGQHQVLPMTANLNPACDWIQTGS
jgi:hypothetical protein